MRPADAFRTAVRSFGGKNFTKEQLKEKYFELVDRGVSNAIFPSYFVKFQHRPYPMIGGVQIEQVPGTAEMYRMVR